VYPPPPEDRTGKKTGWYTHVDGDEVIFPHRLMAGKDSDEITMVSLPPMIWQARKAMTNWGPLPKTGFSPYDGDTYIPQISTT
jgi:hypothetical protein